MLSISCLKNDKTFPPKYQAKETYWMVAVLFDNCLKYLDGIIQSLKKVIFFSLVGVLLIPSIMAFPNIKVVS